MLSYEEAVRVVLDKVKPLPAELVPLEEALGRVLAGPVSSSWDLPPADNSAMDGYAFAYAGQTEGTELPVAGFLPAGGQHPGEVAAGQAVKIMTGAPLPPGCDTVVPIENVTEAAGKIALGSTPKKGQHVRLRGEELRRDEILLPPGTPIRSGEMGILAAGGAALVPVHRVPQVALLSTGDELVELGQAPGPGQIVNSNYHLLAARLREEGCVVLPLGIAKDTPEDLSARIAEGLKADMLISTGGVSVGDRDYVQDTLKKAGFSLGFWRAAIKPGKPVLFGTVEKKAVFGLPGNPAASAATFELFVRPALRRLAGHEDALHPRLRVTLTGGISGGEKRKRFIWGTLQEEGGRYSFTPSARQGSGQNRSIQGSQALLPVPGGSDGMTEGQEAEVMLLRLPPGLR